MRLTRKELVGGAAAASALAAAGIYKLIDQLTAPPARVAAGPLVPEQHLLDGIRVVRDNGIEVLVPPLHHQVVTATLRVGETPAELRDAREALENALRRLNERFEPTPAGLGVTIAWGLPYFERFVPAQAERHLPLDRRASASRKTPVRVLEDAIRFPSDPETTLLEANDVAVLLRSDILDHIAEGAKALFDDLDGLFRVTSIRKGFVGGGFDGGLGLPKQMALAARIEGADLIPDGAELFLGFTSTQKAGLGPSRIANLETLGYADLGPGGYFTHGTHMHLSHLLEDVAAWYLTFDFQNRLDTTFRPGLDVPPETQTVAQGPNDAQTEIEVRRDYARHRQIGHSGSIQPASRLDRDVVGADGTLYPKGTAVPQRADFNTLDNPFFWTAYEGRDTFSEEPAAGLHFVVFNPTSDDFRRTRLAMDGVMPDGTKLAFETGSTGRGFNSILATTHRQNFLVPPRVHRSFPLSELRS
ncbi:MAG: hypothetical protein HW413_566 [Thermoleophilia bacterium]|nr:hypothetical protein [Thermoleophilia bacterium]